MTSFLGYINRAELLKAWKSSGVAFLAVTALITALQYLGSTILADQSSVAAGLVAAVLMQVAGQLKALRDGLPPPPPISPKS